MNLVFSTRLPRIGLAALTLIGAAVAAPRFANADPSTITFAAPTINVTAGVGGVTTSDQTGYFDVTITDSTTDTLAQFQASLILDPGSSGVSIVGGDYGDLSNSYSTVPDGIGDAAGSSPALIDTYVMVGDSSDITGGGYVYFDPTDADNSDITSSGVVTLAANTVYSMEQVYYDIPAGTPVGSYSLTLDQNSLATDPGADFVNLISNSNTVAYFSPGTAINGAIVVNAAVIPEPASVVLMVLGSIGLIGFGLRRARRA
jgi:hypothetical protein